MILNRKALHQEIAAANALSSIEIGTHVTLHFYTTGRSRVDGEWPALILNFISDDIEKNIMYRLRALFFAHEDREQITKLFFETLNRLAVALDNDTTPKDRWENIYALMTDAVTKSQDSSCKGTKIRSYTITYPLQVTYM